MPAISKSGLDEIKEAAIPVHESLYDLEAQYKAIRRRLPGCFVAAMDECIQRHHGSLQALRQVMLDNLDIEPLTDQEIVALGGPGGGGK